MASERVVTHEMARQAYNRMHDALYNGKRVPSLCVPPQPDDVDMVLTDYISQQERAETPQAESTDWLNEPDALLSELKYIASSPSQENGGFHPRVVAAAKATIQRLETPQAVNRQEPDGINRVTLMFPTQDDAIIFYETLVSISNGETKLYLKKPE